jgi:GNAT superfamily N-acetyltransferase
VRAPWEAWTTRELTARTWKDFDQLFGKYGGVQAGCWCMFYHRDRPVGAVGAPATIARNRSDHRQLVGAGRAHGVIVYAKGAPIGWCQFGPREDLPRLEHGRKYASLRLPRSTGPLWRITCFFVDRPFRRKGVARVALHAALEAIRERGGGTVEAYPATHGGAVALWFGTRSMFEREGFREVAPFGRSNVLVRRVVR